MCFITITQYTEQPWKLCVRKLITVAVQAGVLFTSFSKVSKTPTLSQLSFSLFSAFRFSVDEKTKPQV